MATISFTQNVIVKDQSKIQEMKKELSIESCNFQHIKTSDDKNNTKEVSRVWFSLSKK